jgi:mRNA interferase MazF
LKRGDVFWADLAPRSGSEQSGRRPVIVVSHNGFNQTLNWRSIIVVPVSTSHGQNRRALTVVPLPKGTASLPQAGVAVCHQVTTLDRSKLSRQIGSLPKDLLTELEDGLKAALDLQ